MTVVVWMAGVAADLVMEAVAEVAAVEEVAEAAAVGLPRAGSMAEPMVAERAQPTAEATENWMVAERAEATGNSREGATGNSTEEGATGWDVRTRGTSSSTCTMKKF